MNIKKLLYLVPAIVLASATVQAQSLTDLAKAEKARRAKLQKSGGPSKVYTENDQSGGGGSTTEATSTGTAAAGAAPAAAATGKKEKTPEEQAADAQKEWNEKLKQAQDQIKELEATIARNERTMSSLINITPQRADLATQIEADKKKLADLQQQLVNLEDQRRRAGMPRPR
jgi:septal ring factor EnvC (AmiA/AmiB activator)